MSSLLKTTMNIYIWTGVLLFVVLFPSCKGSFHYYNLINVLLFVSYIIMLWNALGREEGYYTYGRLASTVFIYSIIFVGMYLEMSYFYTGDTFYWDFTDPYAYFGMDVKFIDNEVPFLEQPVWLEKDWGWGPSDWGACMGQTLFLKVISSRYFLFFIQIVIGALGAAMMFSIGKKIMRIMYAYMAALTYSISSFSIFYYSSFRKEIFMVFIVISSFWSLYQYISSRRKGYLWLCFFITGMMFFYRPEVVALMVMGISSYFIGKRIDKDNAPFIIILVIMVVGVFFSVISSKLNSFSDDLSKSENYVNTSTFGIVVSSIGVLIGPFPQMIQIGQDDMSQLPLYGPGLLFKYILFLSFWNGFVEILKKQAAVIFPLFFFTIVEMLALAVANDGLELRKAMPHICTYYISAFWFISQYDERTEAEGKTPGLFPLLAVQPKKVLFSLAVLVFLSTFAWNTMRF